MDNRLKKEENGYVFFNISQAQHPTLTLWKIVEQKVQQYKGDIEKAGDILIDNPRVLEHVEHFNKRHCKKEA